MREDVREARTIARQLIAVALAIPLFALVLWVAGPADWPSPMFDEPPWYETAVPLIGGAIYFFGLTWMIRIYRANPEPDEPTWRYRS